MKQNLIAKAMVPVDTLLAPRLERAFGIITYHRVNPIVAGRPAPTLNVTPYQFRTQLKGLLDRGFQPWPLRKTVQYHRRGRAIDRNAFVVVFDDGFENLYHFAWPVLKELGIPATIFVPTAYLDDAGPFPFDEWEAAGSPGVPPESWRALSTDQCRQMLDSGLIELGCHTHWHEDYRGRSDEFSQDLQRSLHVLQSRFQLDAAAFALPFGLSQPEMIAAVRKAGLLCCLTADAQLVTPDDDPFLWGRFGAEQYDTAATLAAKLNGWYSWLRNAWRGVWGSNAESVAEKGAELQIEN